MSKQWLIAALASSAVLLPAVPAAAQLPIPVPGTTQGPTPEPYGTNDGGGFQNVLPPGTNGLDNGAQLAQFEASGARPAHSDDQLSMYANLVGAAPGIADSQLGDFFKDATFGVKPENVERTYSPRSDVTIVRDRFGVPHIYGSTRSGVMFGTGYATAEDRLFFIDVLRHLGRSQLSSFIGGSDADREMDRQQFAVAPYTEADLQKQIDYGTTHYGELGQTVAQDSTDYLAGINQYIAEARLDPSKMPAEYAAIGKTGPDDFTQTDTIAIASLVGGIFGKGGGKELPWAELLQSFQKKLGASAGRKAWLDFRDPDDPEAPTTVRGKSFPYRTSPKKVRAGSVAMPDPGSVKYIADIVGGADSRGRTQGKAATGSRVSPSALFAFPRSNSNALVVSGKHTKSGHPVAVFGPQVGYFAPQILMEQDQHGPGIDATGSAFPGVNLYVELGHGRDYAWSATSAGQDIIDTFALPLCNPSGGAVDPQSTSYMYRGTCEPMEKLERTNSWTPNAADSTPPGSETLTIYRTKLGPAIARATIGGKPVVYTQLRSTYFHEIDSAGGFEEFNNPDTIKSPQDFQRAASHIGYTFNWFYADSKHTAYFNSGNNPVRAARTDPLLPVWGQFAWKGLNTDDHTATYTPFSQHPRVVDQDWMTSWNNKQAPGVAAPDTDTPYTSLYRNLPLDRRIQQRIRGNRKIDRAGLVNAMGDAGTVDMRGAYVLPWVLRVLSQRSHGRPAPASDPAVKSTVAQLRAWVAAGAHRRDTNKDDTYENSDAIRVMDAWWPKLVQSEFSATLGGGLVDQLSATDPIDNTPNANGSHLGSAWDVGFYGTVQKDLRRLLHHRVKGPLSRTYCGRGSLVRCQRSLLTSLKQAMAVPTSELYADDICTAAKRPASQTCFDAISFRPLGALTQPLIPWINRPTFQQVVEVQNGR